MQNLLSFLQDQCTESIHKSFPEVSEEMQKAQMAPCLQENFGHYQCNSALKLAKELKQNSRNVAQKIVENLPPETKKIFEKIDIAGAGFINFTLTPEFLSNELEKCLLDAHLGVEMAEHSQRIVVDFSSPNIAKELHVGHLRSTIIGDCLARLFTFLGNDVLRLNHIGDWGTQFGMLITYMKIYEPDVLSGKKNSELEDLTKWYKASKALFDQDSEFKQKAQQEVVALQSGQKAAMDAWKIICDISKRAFQQIYNLLDIDIIERGESFYNPFLKEIIVDLENKGLVQISDGAKIVNVEGFYNREGKPLPVIVQKSDGGFNYDTTDLAGFRHRVRVEKANRIIIVTDAGQTLHFQMIHKVAVMAGYIDPEKVRFDHVAFGLVLGADRKKFKTRSGETEKLIDLLEEAVGAAKEILKERLSDASEDEIEELAKILGIDAIKYADLSSHRMKDYVFSYERMLKFEGNTAAFLLYAYVRILGIKRKTQVDIEKVIKSTKIKLVHPSEISLGLHLRRFSEILALLSDELLPNRLADYLYDLAVKFNAFFRDCRVEGSEEENERLVLCELTARILKQGLEILGLKTMSRM